MAAPCPSAPSPPCASRRRVRARVPAAGHRRLLAAAITAIGGIVATAAGQQLPVAHAAAAGRPSSVSIPPQSSTPVHLNARHHLHQQQQPSSEPQHQQAGASVPSPSLAHANSTSPPLASGATGQQADEMLSVINFLS